MDMLDLCRQHFQDGRHAEAEQVCRQILQADPKNAQALSALVQILTSQGKYPELAALAREIVNLEPNQVEPRLLLGGALMGLREFGEAETSYQKAAELAPNSPEPLISMGICRICLQRFEEALPCFQKALELRPDHAQAYCFLGNCYRGLGKFAEALAAYDAALRLRPDFAEAHNSRGFTLDEIRRAEEAIASFDEAIRLRPDLYEAHHNRGVALGKLARYPEAIASFEQALRLVPNYPEARRNRALAILVLGDLERGWQEFEWRWKCHDLRMPKHPRPLWEGEPLDGRTILLHVEQGLGDTIQFVRYTAQVKARGGRVVVECQKPLVPLIRTCPGIDVVVPQGEPLPPFDLHTPLLRLMGLFKTRIGTIPAPIPYLTADPQRVVHWREVLGRLPRGFKIGIAWQGNPRHTRDADRSFPLTQFERLAGIEGVQLINLQKGVGNEQLARLDGQFPVVDFGEAVDPGLKTMQDTPALMMSLDLIVTADSSLAHLAGALGRPVWIALPRAPDWRWLIDREDSPWYPTARLFRQARRGEWEPVFERLGKELQKKVRSTAG
jgi:tetratricopeptide (TPR) repeat protein